MIGGNSNSILYLKYDHRVMYDAASSIDEYYE